MKLVLTIKFDLIKKLVSNGEKLPLKSISINLNKLKCNYKLHFNVIKETHRVLINH